MSRLGKVDQVVLTMLTEVITFLEEDGFDDKVDDLLLETNEWVQQMAVSTATDDPTDADEERYAALETELEQHMIQRLGQALIALSGASEDPIAREYSRLKLEEACQT